MSRVQLKHLLLDVDFFDKPKVRALAYKHTQLAVLLYIRWQLLMSRATDALVTRDSLASVAHEVLDGLGTAVATFESVLDYCLKTGMIVQVGPDSFSSERVIKDQETYAIKRAEGAERQKKYRARKEDVSNALLTRLPVTVTDIVSEDLKKGSSLEIPESFDYPDVRQALAMWTSNLRKHKRNIDQIQIEALCARFGTPKKLVDAIRYSCSLSKCLNVIDPPEKSQTQSRAGPGGQIVGSIAASDSRHPALVAQRQRDAQEKREMLAAGNILRGVLK